MLLRTVLVVTLGAFALLLSPAATQTIGARTADGKPDLNGLWQTMNTANWDLEGHIAQAGPMIPLGATGTEPPGMSVVEDGEIPYLPAAAQKKRENYANRLKLDPEVKCYLPGVPRATYMPYPFQIVQSEKVILISGSAQESDGTPIFIGAGQRQVPGATNRFDFRNCVIINVYRLPRRIRLHRQGTSKTPGEAAQSHFTGAESGEEKKVSALHSGWLQRRCRQRPTLLRGPTDRPQTLWIQGLP